MKSPKTLKVFIACVCNLLDFMSNKFIELLRLFRVFKVMGAGRHPPPPLYILNLIHFKPKSTVNQTEPQTLKSFKGEGWRQIR